MKRSILLLMSLVCVGLSVTKAQNITQPKIMVIPFTKEGEDIRTILEQDENKRIVLTKIKEAFDNRGFTTVDFTAKLKAMQSGEVFNYDNKSDLKSQIIDMSGADIYVEAEIVFLKQNVQGQIESSVKIIITAYECATGNSLSNKVGESGKFYTNDISKLAIKAIEGCADDFLKTMQAKFSNISENGRSVMIQIGFDESSTYTMESIIGSDGLQLSDAIELWIENVAYKGDFHMQGVSKNKMVLDDMKLPLVDLATGNNYTISRFGMDFMKFFRTLNINIIRDVRGNTLYITIK